MSLRPIPSQDEREKIEKEAIERELDDCRRRLSTWPPKRKSRAIQSVEGRQAVRVSLPEPHADAYFDHTHHTITRLDFKAPPTLIDQYGLPKRRPLDCMIR